MGYNNTTQASLAGDIKTADQWRAFIAGGRNKVDRKIANNTTVHMMAEGMAAIRLHSTDIVTIFSDGRMILNSGGWRTVTTKERLNRYSPANISQRGGVWYMADGSLFYDGIVIDAAGRPCRPQQPDAYEAKLKVVKKQAKAYAKAYVAALKAGTVDYPDGGDCWNCLMFDSTTGANTEVMSKSTGAQHIRDHLEDNYFVPSLLVNAGRSAGYRDDQIGLMGIGGRQLFIDPERVLYRYIVKRLQEEL